MDSSKNKPVDIPGFNFEKSAHIDYTITKAKLGYVVIDLTVEGDEYYTIKDNDIDRMINYTSESMIEAVRAALERKKTGETIEIMFILKTDSDFEEQISNAEPLPALELNGEVLTEVINSVLRGEYNPGAGLGIKTGLRYVSPSMVASRILDPDNIARLSKRVNITGKQQNTRNRPIILGNKKDPQTKDNNNPNRNDDKNKKNDEDLSGSKTLS